MAKFQLNYVLDKYEPREIENALQKLPVTLEEAYTDLMARIEKGRSGAKRLALKTLQWVSKAARPLRLEELCELLIIEPGDQDIEERYRISPQTVIDACGSLVICDGNEGIVRLAHFTVQQFLSEYDFVSNLRPFPSLARICLAYLGFDEFDGPLGLDHINSQRSQNDTWHNFDTAPLKRRLEKYRATRYVACWWSFHVREEEMDAQVQNQTLAVLEKKNKRNAMLQMRAYVRFNAHDDNKVMNRYPDRTILEILIETGLYMTCKRALWGASNIDAEYVLCFDYIDHQTARSPTSCGASKHEDRDKASGSVRKDRLASRCKCGTQQNC